MTRTLLPLLSLITIVGSAPASTSRILFEDNFDTPESYEEAPTRNATSKEYVARSLDEGHLLKKWRYAWDYSYEGDWRQAFYAVAPGSSVMVQAGRSACLENDYRIVADAEIPADVKAYTIRFRQQRNDNDPIFYLIGAKADGTGGVRLGSEVQLPGTDETVDDLYVRGDVGAGMIKRGLTHMHQWVDVEIQVDVEARTIRWSLAGELVLEGHAESLEPGGYFGLYMCWDRNTQFDDFVIRSTEAPTTPSL